MAGGGLNAAPGGALAACDWHAAQTSKLQIGPESDLKKLQIEKNEGKVHAQCKTLCVCGGKCAEHMSHSQPLYDGGCP
jgi:hypothetical protein